MGMIQWGARLRALPRVNRMPVDLPLRTVFISDVHMSRHFPDASVRALFRQIHDLAPELLLLGGDYAETLDEQRAFFHHLRAACPAPMVYAVLGNNDARCYQNDTERARAEWAEAGVTLLLNEECRIPVPGGAMALAGVDEARYGHPDARGFFRDATDCRHRILLAHYPQTRLLAETALPPTLLLSGHTHGGQINIKGLSCYTFGFEYNAHLLGNRGVLRCGTTCVLISNGIGTSKLPIRVGAWSEIHALY